MGGLNPIILIAAHEESDMYMVTRRNPEEKQNRDIIRG